MAKPFPVAEVGAFSSSNATPTEWPETRDELAVAELYWLSNVRRNGRPHVTPMLAIWLEGVMYGADRRSEPGRVSDGEPREHRRAP